MTISLNSSFTASPTQSCYLNYQIQSHIWNWLDDTSEEAQYSRLTIFGAWCGSNTITAIMRTVAVAEVFFKGSYNLLRAPFTEIPIINATTGIHELCVGIPKNILRMLFTIGEFIIEIPLLLIHPKYFTMTVAECMKRNLKHAEVGSLSSNAHKQDLACIDGIVKPTFMKYQRRMFNRDPLSKVFIPNSIEPISLWKQDQENEINKLLFRESLLDVTKPVSMPSKIDENIQISKSHWGVTLITHPSNWSKNQALIIVEGLADDYFKGVLSNGEYFMHISELHPPIRSNIFFTYEYRGILGMKRTEVYVKSNEQVAKMLRQIRQEETKQRQQLCTEGKDVAIPVSEYDALFYDRNRNSFTWAKSQLKILDIDVEESQINIVTK